MKRIIRSVAKALWRMSWPARRPFVARLDARVSRLIAGTIEARLITSIAESSARLERIERTIDRADRAAAVMVEEMDVVLNGLTREVFRLQAQVERLQRGLGEAGRPDPNVLSILDGTSEDDNAHEEAVDRARVG